MKEPFVCRIDRAKDEAGIIKTLENYSFSFSKLQDAYWKAKSKDCTVIFYHSGKLTIQGKSSETIKKALFGDRPSPRQKTILEGS